MNRIDARLERLLRAAAHVREETAALAPFGFDTRAIALWRAGMETSGNGIARLVRRVALLATVVLLTAGVASLREFRQTEDIAEPTSNEFAIADSAIDNEFYQ
jgi:hypothetical protein